MDFTAQLRDQTYDQICWRTAVNEPYVESTVLYAFNS
jgi:hypothetical protein